MATLCHRQIWRMDEFSEIRSLFKCFESSSQYRGECTTNNQLLILYIGYRRISRHTMLLIPIHRHNLLSFMGLGYHTSKAPALSRVLAQLPCILRTPWARQLSIRPLRYEALSITQALSHALISTWVDSRISTPPRHQ